MSSYIFDAHINPSTLKHNKNFLNNKLQIISEKLSRDLMIRPTPYPTISFPVSSNILPSSRETSIL